MISLRRDEGFTVAEVVIAAAIMFFAMTALIGLMGSSSQMTVQAKHKTTLVNAVASMIDEVRATTWEDIDSVWTGTRTYYPDGADGLVVTVTNTVETKFNEGQPFIKILRVSATGSLGGMTQYFQTRVAIRNPAYNATVSSDPDAPQVVFLEGTPDDDEVLFGSERLAGGAVLIYTKSYGPADPLEEVRYEVAGAPLTSNSGGSAVVFAPSTNPFTAPGVSWNTAQTTVVDGVTVPKYHDGFQTLSVTAVDASFRSTTVRRRFILDNINAAAPANVGGTAPASNQLVLTWDAARDGGTDGDPCWASQYEYRVYREPVSGGGSNPADWPQAPASPGPVYKPVADVVRAIQNEGPFSVPVSVADTATPALSRECRPFSRYFVGVTSGGPRGRFGTASMSAGAIVTPPELMCEEVTKSTVRVVKGPGKYTYTVDVAVTTPNFPTSTPEPVYSIEYKTQEAGSIWTPWSGSPRVVTYGDGYVRIAETRIMSTANFKPYDFRVAVTGVTPSGYQGGTALPALYTNIGRMPLTIALSPALNTLFPVWGQ